MVAMIKTDLDKRAEKIAEVVMKIRDLTQRGDFTLSEVSVIMELSCMSWLHGIENSIPFPRNVLFHAISVEPLQTEIIKIVNHFENPSELEKKSIELLLETLKSKKEKGGSTCEEQTK